MKIGQEVYWNIGNVTERNLKENCIEYDKDTDCGLVVFTIDTFIFKDGTIGIGFSQMRMSFGILINEINKTLFENKDEAICKFNNTICTGRPISHEDLSNK